jgi:hypothetical protein
MTVAEPLLSLRLLSAASGHHGRDPLLARHVVAYDTGDVPSAYGSRQDDGLWLEVPEVVTFHLAAEDNFLTAIPEASADADAVLDAYYGTALPLVLQATRGVEVLHGGAVLVPPRNCVIAVCGTSESGKSTLAYGLAARGHRQWADDAVAFRLDGSDPLSVGLPFTVKLRESAAAYFGASSDALQVVEDYAWSSAPLGAVFLLEPPRPTDTEERAVVVERLAPADALRELLPNAFRFQPQPRERRRATMHTYLDLVASVPILSARFSPDLDRLPELLDELQRWVQDIA